MRSILCILFTITAGIGSAQLSWEEAGSAFGSLPSSVKLFRTTDSLNGRPFIAYYAEVNIKDKSILFSTDTTVRRRLTPTEYYKRNNQPLLVVNGSFFSFNSNQNLNAVVNKGRLLSYNTPSVKSKITGEYYYPTRSAIGISRKRKADIAWLFTDTINLRALAFQTRPILAKGKTSDPSIYDLKTLDPWKYWKVRTAIGGGPVLVQSGQKKITNKEEQLFLGGESDLHPRTAMGYTNKDKLIILLVEGRNPNASGATLEELADIMISLKCEEALNLDGGGSSTMLINGKETIKPSDREGQRPVPAVFMITSRRQKKNNRNK